jgi:ectoine hydroxylase-related dioxygenase (phytanoyl-CoA dioxygenase family)
MLNDQGFEIIPGVLGPNAVASLGHAIQGSSLPRSRAGMRKAMELREVVALATDPTLVQFAKQALGQDAIPFRATLFDKSSDSNWLVAWHQDTALPLRKKHEAPGWGPWSVKEGVVCAHAPASALEQILAIRVHLDDSRADNGPLRVLPGTHTEGVLSDDSIQELARQVASVEGHVPAGGILLMRPLLVHASSKVRTDARRRVIHIEDTSQVHLSEGVVLRVLSAEQ